MIPLGSDEAVRLRQAVTRLARKLTSTASDVGLAPSEASVLGLIDSRGPVSASELIELEHINRTMLSRIVSRLDHAGLIDRRSHPDDARAVVFEVTLEGRAASERIKDHRAGLVAAGLSELRDADLRKLRAALPALELLADAVTPRQRRHPGRERRR